MNSAHSPTFPSLHLRHNSFSKPSVAVPTSQLILLPFRCFTYVTAHSQTLALLYLRHSSLYNPSGALPTSQLILKPFHCFTYVTAHSQTLPLLHLRHSSFSNPSVALPTSQLILQLFFCFSYITSSSLNSSGQPLMLHLTVISPASQTLHLCHLASRPSYTAVYTLILYMRLIVPYGEGNATHDRGSILLI